jgi:hypothetical protein
VRRAYGDAAGLDPHDSFHFGYVFRIHFIISKELLKDLTGGFKVV